jgi:hypothetical protein
MKAQGVGLVCPPVAHDGSMEPINRAAIIKATYVRISVRHSPLYSWRRNDVSLDSRGPDRGEVAGAEERYDKGILSMVGSDIVLPDKPCNSDTTRTARRKLDYARFRSGRQRLPAHVDVVTAELFGLVYSLVGFLQQGVTVFSVFRE